MTDGPDGLDALDDLMVRASAWLMPRVFALLALVIAGIAHRLLVDCHYVAGTIGALISAMCVIAAVGFSRAP